MKRIVGGLIILLLVLCSCGKGTLTWQEQYDLGVKYITGTQTYLDDIDEHENVKTQSLNTTKEYDRGSLLPITDERDRLDGVFNASYSKEDVESIKWGD